MSAKTGIEWTDATFNPWWGCTKVSPGCDHCYAEGVASRFGTPWGARQVRRTFGEKHWNEPLHWNARAEREGRRLRVFCASMADVFDNDAPEGARERLFALIRDTPHLDWQLLTKRIGNARKMLPSDWGDGYSNVWLGATIVNQDEADRDIPKLLATPSRIRFLSCEPLLGPVNVTWALSNNRRHVETGLRDRGVVPSDPKQLRGIDWVIAGGESGRRARPMHPDWARFLRAQCWGDNVPFFFKQWGEWAPHQAVAGGDEGGDLRAGRVRYLQGDGREPDGHFRRGDAAVARIGKKAAGHLLDGVEHHAFPRDA